MSEKLRWKQIAEDPNASPAERDAARERLGGKKAVHLSEQPGIRIQDLRLAAEQLEAYFTLEGVCGLEYIRAQEQKAVLEKKFSPLAGPLLADCDSRYLLGNTLPDPTASLGRLKAILPLAGEKLREQITAAIEDIASAPYGEASVEAQKLLRGKHDTQF